MLFKHQVLLLEVYYHFLMDGDLLVEFHEHWRYSKKVPVKDGKSFQLGFEIC